MKSMSMKASVLFCLAAILTALIGVALEPSVAYADGTGGNPGLYAPPQSDTVGEPDTTYADSESVEPIGDEISDTAIPWAVYLTSFILAM